MPAPLTPLAGAARRIGYAVASATTAAVFMGIFTKSPMAWNSIGYWLFVSAVFCLAIPLYGRID